MATTPVFVDHPVGEGGIVSRSGTVRTAFPAVAHARRGFPLFIIISDNPFLLVLGLVLAGVWAYFRFAD